MNRQQTSEVFFRSASVLLVLTGLAKLLSISESSRILAAETWLFGLTYRELMVIGGVIELATAVLLLKRQLGPARSMLLLWLACNFLLFRLVSFLTDSRPCPCLGSFAGQLGLDNRSVEWFLRFLIAYFVAGSSAMLVISKQILESPNPAGLQCNSYPAKEVL